MVRTERRRTKLLSALAAVAVAGIVGCGGGGAGGSKGVMLGGSNGGSGGTDATTGEITTGGTTSAAVTTGSGSTTGISLSTTGSSTSATGGVITTGAVTTGTDTAGSSTSGAAGTSGSTTATTGTSGTSSTTSGTSATSGTTSAGTSGTPTTTGTSGSGTTGTNGTTGTSSTGTTSTAGSTSTSGTTGTSNTGASNTTSTTGDSGTTATTGTDTTGTTGTGGGGDGATNYRRSNAIYFGHYGDSSIISSVLSDGTAREDLNGGDGDVATAVPDPSGGFVYAKMVNGHYGVYRGASYDAANSTTLAAPIYDSVSTLQTTANGAVMMVASANGETQAFLLAGGDVTAIDDADDAAVTIDGSTVAYTKDNGGTTDLYVWNRSTGVSTDLNTGGDSILPSFSKDGAWILFSSTRDRGDGEAYDLYQIHTSGGTVERITNTPGISEVGACYNESRTMVSYVGLSSDPNLAGLYVLSNAGATRIAGDSDMNLSTYWTDSQGRSIRRSPGRFQRLHTKRRR